MNNDHDKGAHVAIDVAPPPPFSVYEPEFSLTSNGNIISHDHHLNEDGEALHRFLLAQSLEPPTYLLNIVGTHRERRSRIVSTGNGTTRVQNDYVTICDFDFYINLTSYISRGPVFWSYSDSVPAYRGLMSRQLTEDGILRKATFKEGRHFHADEEARVASGLAPWQAPDGSQNQASTLTPRQWADAYATSPKPLKEFLYEKVVYGWNPTKLEEAIASAIAQTSYTGKVACTFRVFNNKIRVRPDTRFSRTLDSTWVKVLLCITLIYPFIWLYKRFFAGGKWEVIGAAYALKHLEPLDGPLDETQAGFPTEQQYPSKNTRVVETDQGYQKLTGYREGEWFREWEPTIKRCAAMGLTSDDPLNNVNDGPANPANNLDGYAPAALDGY